jgi:hypothetical protein
MTTAADHLKKILRISFPGQENLLKWISFPGQENLLKF